MPSQRPLYVPVDPQDSLGISPTVPQIRGPQQQAPSHLGGHEIVRELGRGGMGVVYEARCPETGRRVALKLLHAGASDEDVGRLRIEARTMARARHPHVVTIHYVGQAHDRWYLILDLIEGPSLKDELREFGPMSSRHAAQVAEKLAGALEHTHGQAILHRDVKPSNVLIGAGNEPLLTDFGLARDNLRDSGYTVTGAVLGTPAYMSPEQALGVRRSVDDRADVYGLGATLYEMLCGKPPFSGPLMGVLQAVIMDDPPNPGSVHPGVDPILEGICLRAMAKEPARRYPTMRDFGEHLRAYLDGALELPLTSRTRSGRVVRFDPASTGSFVWSPPRSRRRRPTLSRLALTASVASVLAAGLALPMALLLAPGDESTGATRLATPELGSAAALARAGWRPSEGAIQKSDEDGHDSGHTSSVELTPPPRLIRGSDEGRQRPDQSSDEEARSERTGDESVSGGSRAEREARARVSGREELGESKTSTSLAAVITMRGDLGASSSDSSESGAEEEAATEQTAAEQDLADANDPDRAETPIVGDPNDAGDPLPVAGGTPSELNKVTEALLVYAGMQRQATAYESVEALVVADRAAAGYQDVAYYQSATAQTPGLLEDYGPALLVGNSSRVDWIVDGQVYPEVLLSAPATSAATARGLAFVATADSQVADSGDVYRRALDGRWEVSLDGNGPAAVVGSFRGDVYAAVSGAPGVNAELFRFNPTTQIWDLAAELGDCLPTHVLEFQREIWVIGTPRVDGDGIHLYHGSGGFFVREKKPSGGRRSTPGERERATATATQSGNLFLATVKELDGVVVEGQLLVFQTGKKGETKFKRLGTRLKGEAPLCLAYQDRTLYVGTDQGRLIYLERKPDKKGGKAKKFSALFREDSSIRFNNGIHSLLPRAGGGLLVGIEGNVGAEVLLRRPKGTRVAQQNGQSGQSAGPG